MTFMWRFGVVPPHSKVGGKVLKAVKAGDLPCCGGVLT